MKMKDNNKKKIFMTVSILEKTATVNNKIKNCWLAKEGCLNTLVISTKGKIYPLGK